MVALSWFMFTWLFVSAELDRNVNRKSMAGALKKIQKSLRRNGKAGRGRARFLYEKWSWFGSGFYGLAALWTFAVIEIGQFAGFLMDGESWAALTRDGLLGFLISFALNQLGNMLQGLLWFTWWPTESILLWFVVAYLGYWTGVELARRSIVPQQFAVYDQIISRLRTFQRGKSAAASEESAE